MSAFTLTLCNLGKADSPPRLPVAASCAPFMRHGPGNNYKYNPAKDDLILFSAGLGEWPRGVKLLSFFFSPFK